MSTAGSRAVIAAGLAVVAAAGLAWLWRDRPAPTPATPDVLAVSTPSASVPTPAPADAAPATTTPAPAAKAEAPRDGVPGFDVVRVEPTGDSVIAGRTVPGATVDLLRNGEPFARVVADPSGLFAFVPKVLEPGEHELSLAALAPDGTRLLSAQSVTVVIAPGGRTAPLVTVTAPGQPVVTVSRPEAPAAPPAVAAAPVPAMAPPARPGERVPVGIVSVETEGEGRLYVAGSAAPGATLRLYLNDAFVAPGAAGADGRLAFSIERGIRPGDYRVRLDDVDAVSGAVRSRAEVPFAVPATVASTTPGAARPSPPTGRVAVASASPTGFAGPGGAVLVPEVSTAVVTRGETLWRISRRVYGRGMRYTVIYGANAPQIRDPNRIYPGQVFVLPAEPMGEAR